MSIRRLKVGDEITEGWLNELIALANSCSLSVGSGGNLTVLSGPEGYTIDADFSEPIWGITTGPLASGTYPFTQQFPDTAGTWINGTLTDVAYEVNGNTSVATGKRAKFWWTAQGTWAFNAGTC